jgi:hypothetical protein
MTPQGGTFRPPGKGQKIYKQRDLGPQHLC